MAWFGQTTILASSDGGHESSCSNELKIGDMDGRRSHGKREFNATRLAKICGPRERRYSVHKEVRYGREKPT